MELCPDDKRLRDFVLSMAVRRSERSEFFLDRPIGLTEPISHWKPGDLAGQRFRIERLLGSGGMGEVYEAVDQHLGDSIALKRLHPRFWARPDVIERFRFEVKRARRVSHPNVCHTYEFYQEEGGLCYLTMELLRGETLAQMLKSKGRLRPSEAAGILRQVADGLDAVHRAGLVHRDLKPANVMMARRGEAAAAVLMDFGIARNAEESAADATITGSRQIIGTPAYMAPEQLEGAKISSRADIYALGLLAYELVTGRTMLDGRSAHAAALLGRGDSDAGLPPGWRNPILRCLEHDPQKRFASAPLFVSALEPAGIQWKHWSRRAIAAASAVAAVGLWAGRGRTPTPVRVAVLPFDLSGPGDVYLAEGLTDALSEQLRRHPRIEVAGRASVYQFQGRAMPAAEMARRLNVSRLVRASVSQLTGELALAVQVIDPSQTTPVFTRAYQVKGDRTSAAARLIAADLLPLIVPGGGDLAGQTGARGAAAYDKYLQGRYYFNRRDPGDLEKAIGFFEEARKLDASFAAAQAGLCDALCALADVGHTDVPAALERAAAAAREAVRLDAGYGHGHASLALVTSFQGGAWEQAERSFQRAAALDPQDVAARQWYSALLLKLGRFDDCMREASEAVRLDPVSLAANVNLANMALLCRRYPEALRLFEKVQQLAPDFWFVHEALGETYARLGRREDSLREIGLALRLSRTRGRALSWAANAYAILGDRDRALATLAELTAAGTRHSYQPFHVARAYAQLGMATEAFGWLERARSARDIGLQIVQVHHSFEGLAGDPRFDALLSAEKLPRR